MLDTQVAQLAVQNPSKQPGNLPPHGKQAYEQVNAISLRSECNAALQANLSPKLKDLGSFSILCHISSLAIDKALCDLGASVSVMPYSICKKFNMGELSVTNMTLQMADKSLKRPLGVLEDVPVRVEKYFIPVDFIVMNMVEDSQVPIILGRPLLHTAGAVIYVRNGSLILRFGDDKITFILDKALKHPELKATCHIISTVDHTIDNVFVLCLDRNQSDALLSRQDHGTRK
ncbi:uncharacterized protein LOC141638983 [Silene latifolia]|uniref:uncharacterized protein LOC141638983 n=1 Tax=Silene latifolia TaxID=37657 RepID=UPI003D771364